MLFTLEEIEHLKAFVELARVGLELKDKKERERRERKAQEEKKRKIEEQKIANLSKSTSETSGKYRILFYLNRPRPTQCVVRT